MVVRLLLIFAIAVLSSFVLWGVTFQVGLSATNQAGRFSQVR